MKSGKDKQGRKKKKVRVVLRKNYELQTVSNLAGDWRGGDDRVENSRWRVDNEKKKKKTWNY